jgi:hypothetical protein
MSERPVWKFRNKRDAKAMVDWVNEQLDRESSNPFLEHVKLVEAMYGGSLEEAIERADKGDVEPLRRLFPELARFIHRPRLKRGQRFPKNPETDPVGKAVDDYQSIRALWRRTYGIKNRRTDDPVTALKIAADRNGVDVDKVINRLKKSRPK